MADIPPEDLILRLLPFSVWWKSSHEADRISLEYGHEQIVRGLKLLESRSQMGTGICKCFIGKI